MKRGIQEQLSSGQPSRTQVQARLTRIIQATQAPSSGAQAAPTANLIPSASRKATGSNQRVPSVLLNHSNSSHSALASQHLLKGQVGLQQHSSSYFGSGALAKKNSRSAMGFAAKSGGATSFRNEAASQGVAKDKIKVQGRAHSNQAKNLFIVKSQGNGQGLQGGAPPVREKQSLLQQALGTNSTGVIASQQMTSPYAQAPRVTQATSQNVPLRVSSGQGQASRTPPLLPSQLNQEQVLKQATVQPSLQQRHQNLPSHLQQFSVVPSSQPSGSSISLASQRSAQQFLANQLASHGNSLQNNSSMALQQQVSSFSAQSLSQKTLTNKSSLAQGAGLPQTHGLGSYTAAGASQGSQHNFEAAYALKGGKTPSGPLHNNKGYSPMNMQNSRSFYPPVIGLNGSQPPQTQQPAFLEQPEKRNKEASKAVSASKTAETPQSQAHYMVKIVQKQKQSKFKDKDRVHKTLDGSFSGRTHQQRPTSLLLHPQLAAPNVQDSFFQQSQNKTTALSGAKATGNVHGQEFDSYLRQRSLQNVSSMQVGRQVKKATTPTPTTGFRGSESSTMLHSHSNGIPAARNQTKGGGASSSVSKTSLIKRIPPVAFKPQKSLTPQASAAASNQPQSVKQSKSDLKQAAVSLTSDGNRQQQQAVQSKLTKPGRHLVASMPTAQADQVKSKVSRTIDYEEQAAASGLILGHTLDPDQKAKDHTPPLAALQTLQPFDGESESLVQTNFPGQSNTTHGLSSSLEAESAASRSELTRQILNKQAQKKLDRKSIETKSARNLKHALVDSLNYDRIGLEQVHVHNPSAKQPAASFKERLVAKRKSKALLVDTSRDQSEGQNLGEKIPSSSDASQPTALIMRHKFYDQGKQVAVGSSIESSEHVSESPKVARVSHKLQHKAPRGYDQPLKSNSKKQKLFNGDLESVALQVQELSPSKEIPNPKASLLPQLQSNDSLDHLGSPGEPSLSQSHGDPLSRLASPEALQQPTQSSPPMQDSAHLKSSDDPTDLANQLSTSDEQMLVVSAGEEEDHCQKGSEGDKLAQLDIQVSLAPTPSVPVLAQPLLEAAPITASTLPRIISSGSIQLLQQENLQGTQGKQMLRPQPAEDPSLSHPDQVSMFGDHLMSRQLGTVGSGSRNQGRSLKPSAQIQIENVRPSSDALSKRSNKDQISPQNDRVSAYAEGNFSRLERGTESQVKGGVQSSDSLQSRHGTNLFSFGNITPEFYEQQALMLEKKEPSASRSKAAAKRAAKLARSKAHQGTNQFLGTPATSDPEQTYLALESGAMYQTSSTPEGVSLLKDSHMALAKKSGASSTDQQLQSFALHGSIQEDSETTQKHFSQTSAEADLDTDLERSSMRTAHFRKQPPSGASQAGQAIRVAPLNQIARTGALSSKQSTSKTPKFMLSPGTNSIANSKFEQSVDAEDLVQQAANLDGTGESPRHGKHKKLLESQTSDEILKVVHDFHKKKRTIMVDRQSMMHEDSYDEDDYYSEGEQGPEQAQIDYETFNFLLQSGEQIVDPEARQAWYARKLQELQQRQLQEAQDLLYQSQDRGLIDPASSISLAGPHHYAQMVQQDKSYAQVKGGGSGLYRVPSMGRSGSSQQTLMRDGSLMLMHEQVRPPKKTAKSALKYSKTGSGPIAATGPQQNSKMQKVEVLSYHLTGQGRRESQQTHQNQQSFPQSRARRPSKQGKEKQSKSNNYPLISTQAKVTQALDAHLIRKGTQIQALHQQRPGAGAGSGAQGPSGKSVGSKQPLANRAERGRSTPRSQTGMPQM